MELKDYLPIWHKLTVNEQQLLNNSVIKKSFPKNTILHNGKEDCSGLFIIINGEARVYTISDTGREITVYRLFERDICLFSASCILNSIQFDVTVETQKPTDALMIPADVYKNIMEQSAPLSNFTNELMASRFTDVMWLLDQIMWKSFDARLAEFLLEQSANENTLSLKITHEEIGKHLGNPREVVTRMLKYFSSEGIVSLSRGTIEILDTDKLIKITEK